MFKKKGSIKQSDELFAQMKIEEKKCEKNY